MPWQWTQYTIPFALAATISAGLAGYGMYRLRSDRSPLVVGFVLTTVGSTVWTTLSLVRISATTLPAKLLLWNLDVGKNVTVLGFLIFALAYAGYDRWLRPRRLAILALWPAAFYLLVRPTWQYHDLWMNEPAILSTPGFRKVYFGGGIAGSVDAFWAYGVVAAGMGVVAWTAYRERGVYRRQAVLILVGALVPTALNVPLMLDGWRIVPGAWPYAFNPSPVAMSVTGIALAVAISRYRFLDLVPIARDGVIERMRDGYVVLDEADRVVDCNPAARRLLDLDRDAIGEPFGAVLHGEDLVEERPDGRLQGEITVGDGEDRRYVQVDVSPLSEDGRFVGRLVRLRDVTERRSIEQRYQALIEHSSDLITVLDADGSIRYQSPAVQRVLGYDPDDLRGRPVFEFIHPEDRAEIFEAFETVAAGGGDGERVEFRVRTADGEYRRLEALGQDLDDPTVEGIVVNSRDVTRRRERERELQRQNERLDEFASLVSHDLRNPLSVAKGRLELVDHGRDPETQLPTVEDSLDRMESIIDDVLALSRHGKDVADPEPVDLEERARTAWGNVDTGRADLRVPESTELAADPDRLLQLFENLFRNAIEHNHPDVTVTVGTLSGSTGAGDGEPIAAGESGDADRSARGFYVEDDGSGIPPEERDSVLRSGFTTADDGTGFGLSIVDRIADAHGWRVQVTEGEDGGARFEIRGLARQRAVEATDD